MKKENLFDYPNYLNKIFDKLKINGIKSIFVGGYVRDYLLKIDSKDIDIELYGVLSFTQLENILKEFGSLNLVGKSFGVCKLSLKNIEIDFTLPRRDNKIASGHRGFFIQTDKDLDFTTACSRRDFTMNAIGFDVDKQKFLDPFNGINDIKNKIIRAVDLDTFEEDPLRVFRAVSFASRFKFTLDNKLFLLCQNMCERNLLFELSKERIYEEVKKILKSSHPSIAFLLLRKLNGLKYLHPLETIKDDDFLSIMQAIDTLQKLKQYDNRINMFLFLSLLCYKFNKQEIGIFITNLTNKKNLPYNINSLVSTTFQHDYTDSELLTLATTVNIEVFLTYSEAILPKVNKSIFASIKNRAIQLEVLNEKKESLLRGSDLLNLGVKPSKEYSHILSLAYDKQLKLEIQSHKEALEWLQGYLLT